MAKQKSGSLVGDVLADVPVTIKHGTSPWYLRIKPEHQAAVDELREAWVAGKIPVPKMTASRIISRKLNERGISTVGAQGVLSWLGHIS